MTLYPVPSNYHMLTTDTVTNFQNLIWNYYANNKRNFPWRDTTDPYHILVSEIMLQQTQTDRVVPKYENFLLQFPTVYTLASAPQAEVLIAWQGLGYNRRALALQRAAQQVVEKFAGTVPYTAEELQSLPGIGPYTAAAVMAFACNLPATCIETNIRRIYLHHFFADVERVADKELLLLIAQTIDFGNPREWYYALMDYGAALPKHVKNPNQRSKHYVKQSSFAGSNRQLRGAIIRLLTSLKRVSVSHIARELDEMPERITDCAAQLQKEGFIAVIDQDLLLV